MDWEGLLDEAAQALEEQRHHEALQLCDRVAMLGGEARYHAAILRGDVLLDLGDAGGALSSYETVADPDVQDPELDCARGIALFELGRLAEAESALKSSLRGNADLAEAHYALGLVAELLGTGQEVEYFRRARRLDPDRYPPKPQMSRDEFEEVVEESLTLVPKTVQAALQSVPVIIAELPHPDDIKNAEPPLSPLALGMYVGPPPGLDDLSDLPSVEQPAMVLFKRNLERSTDGKNELKEEIARTVVHELGHVLGLSDDELELS